MDKGKVLAKSGFQLSVIKPKPKQLLWPIKTETDNPVNQSELELGKYM